MVLIGQTLQAHKGLTTEHLLRFTRLLGFEERDKKGKKCRFIIY